MALRPYVFYLKGASTMLPCGDLVAQLWPHAPDYDSDGDALDPADTRWTELMVILRDDSNESLDIVPHQDDASILIISGSTEAIAARAAGILAIKGNGLVSHNFHGPYQSPDAFDITP